MSEQRKYLQPLDLPKKDLSIKIENEGDGEAGIPRTYRIGDSVVEGVRLGPQPVGRKVAGEGKRGGYSLPGANAAIRNYIKNKESLKSGGKNKFSWDSDDIHWFDKMRGVTTKDLENAELNEQLQSLRETHKNTRVAGQTLKKLGIEPQFGDTVGQGKDDLDSVQQRIQMLQSVNKQKREEPTRVRREIQEAINLGENQNRDIRADEYQANAFARLFNKDIDQEAARQDEFDLEKDRFEFDKDRLKKQDKDRALEFQQTRQDAIKRDLANLGIREKEFGLSQRRLDIEEDRLDREEKRRKEEAFTEMLGNVFEGLSGLL